MTRISAAQAGVRVLADGVGDLVWQITHDGLPEPAVEFPFTKGSALLITYAHRRWRFDIAWPDYHVAVEIDGGLYVGGRHVSGSGFEADMEKLNAAALDDWLVLRFTPRQASGGDAIGIVRSALMLRENWHPLR